MRLSLKWRPRAENQLADDLTNSNFGAFSSENRIHLKWQDVDTSLLSLLLGAKDEYEESLAKLKASHAFQEVTPRLKKAKLMKSVW